MSDPDLYETISAGYSSARRADPRIAAHIHDALGDAATVLNVGAGSGNYEPGDRAVVALEPTVAMIALRPPGAAPVVRGVAEALPFPDRSFDAAMGVLTVHHWVDLARGLAELRRVADRQVIFVFDPARTADLWIVQYFIEAVDVPSERNAPGPDDLARHLDLREVRHVPVPRDCTDGFGAAYWARPEAYLDPGVQAGMSWLARLDPEILRKGEARLRADLDSGRWHQRFGHLLELDELDAGYRLVIAGS